MEPKQMIEAWALKHGVSMVAEFVPFSKSRNAKEKHKSLNWKVTLYAMRGAPIITTDYMQGSGHCPAYKASVKELGNRDCIMREGAITFECETGKAYLPRYATVKKLPGPELADVLSSLSMESDVIDYRGFEDWAENFGYESDSRKAEAVYKACLDIALKLRNGFGDAAMAELALACQDY